MKRPLGKILIVDDTEANRYTLSRHLQRAGYQVLEASTAEEAMFLARKFPDLILLDIKLPDRSGYDVCAEIKTDPQLKGIPVVHISASLTRGEDHWRGVEGGADAFLITPTDPLILLSTVKAWIRASRADQEREKLWVKSEEQKEALRQSEERLRFALDAAEMGTWRYDVQTKLVIRDGILNRILGLRSEDGIFSADDFQERVFPEDREKIKSNLETTARTGQPYRIEFRIIRTDGVIRWLRSQGKLTNDASGRPLYITGAVMDITERKQAEEALRTSQHELGEFIRLSPVPMAVYRGPDHVYTFANPAHDEMIGKRVQGRPIREALTDEELGETVSLLDRVYQSGEPFEGKDLSYTIYGEDGKPRHLCINLGFYPFRNVDGKIEGILGVAQDVTHQARLREEVSTVLNALPIAVSRLDHQERYVFVNQSFEKYFGPSEAILGKTIGECFNESYELIKDKVQAALRGEAVEFERALPDFQNKTNGLHHFMVNYTPVRTSDERVQGFISSHFNINGLKKAEKRLKAAYDEVNLQKTQLEEERELRERFVATLSHDLRTPLTAAKISSQIISRKLSDKPELQKLAGRITDNMDRADKMIRDLLDASFIKAGGKLSLEIDICNLNEIISDTLEELSTINGDRFSFQVSGPVEPIEGYWSCSGIRRILENLCHNAIKYGSPHRPVTISLSQEEENVLIAVHNEGPPISMEDQIKLFDPFRRTSSAQNGGQKGWGLGLTLVRGIVEAHGGRVGVESSAEQGTTFRVVLPRDARNEKEKEKGKEKE